MLGGGWRKQGQNVVEARKKAKKEKLGLWGRVGDDLLIGQSTCKEKALEKLEQTRPETA